MHDYGPRVAERAQRPDSTDGPRTPRTPCPTTSDTVAYHLGHRGLPTPDTVSANSNAFVNARPSDSTALEVHERAVLWSEKNTYIYRAFCEELKKLYGASVGRYDIDHEQMVRTAARRTGVPEHIALALTQGAS